MLDLHVNKGMLNGAGHGLAESTLVWHNEYANFALYKLISFFYFPITFLPFLFEQQAPAINKKC